MYLARVPALTKLAHYALFTNLSPQVKSAAKKVEKAATKVKKVCLNLYYCHLRTSNFLGSRVSCSMPLQTSVATLPGGRHGCSLPSSHGHWNTRISSEDLYADHIFKDAKPKTVKKKEPVAAKTE